MNSETLRIFVLSDTHNHLPREWPALVHAVDEIWHLGDVCDEPVLAALREIGPPLMVVRGNCDGNFEWPLIRDLVRHGVRFRLVHIPPKRAPEGVDVLLHGHTHVPRNEMVNGVRFLNPGCVTRPNRGAVASVALLELAPDGTLRWQLAPTR